MKYILIRAKHPKFKVLSYSNLNYNETIETFYTLRIKHTKEQMIDYSFYLGGGMVKIKLAYMQWI